MKRTVTTASLRSFIHRFQGVGSERDDETCAGWNLTLDKVTPDHSNASLELRTGPNPGRIAQFGAQHPMTCRLSCPSSAFAFASHYTSLGDQGRVVSKGSPE